MKTITIVVNGVSFSAEEANLTEVQAILKQAIEGQLTIQKQEDDAHSKLQMDVWSRFDSWLVKAGEYYVAIQAKATAFKSSYLERKYQLKKEYLHAQEKTAKDPKKA